MDSRRSRRRLHTNRKARGVRHHFIRAVAERVCVSRSWPHQADHGTVSLARLLSQHGIISIDLQDQSMTAKLLTIFLAGACICAAEDPTAELLSQLIKVNT